MASLFKKTFAAVLAIAMVVTCFTVSAANEAPSINVSSVYITADATQTTVDIYTENFDTIYGAQFTVTLPEGFTVADVESNSGLAWDIGSNCTVNENVIKFLDVRTSQGFDVTVNVNVPEAAKGVNEILVSDTYFIDSNEAEYEGVDVNNGVISVETAVEVPEGETETTVSAQEGYFIPFGEVLVNGEYVDKEDDGSFKVTGNTTVTQIKLPSEEVGVTTFGNGVKEVDDDFGKAGVQFGSYAVNVEGKKFGTLVVKGDFADFISYCRNTLSMSNEQIYNKLVSLYNENSAGGSVGMKYGENGEKRISVLCIARKKWMWYGNIGGVMHLQYAARVTNPVVGETYSAVAYSFVDEAYTFSKEISDITR